MKRRVLEGSFMLNGGKNIKDVRYSDENLIVCLKDFIRQQNEAFHTHNFFEFDIILDGTGENITDKGSTPISKGSVIYETPAGIHTLASSGETHFKVINVCFAGELEQIAMDVFGGFDEFVIQCSDAELEYILRELTEILSQKIKNRADVFAHGSAMKTMAFIADIAERQNLVKPCSPTDKNIMKAILYIRRNYFKPIKLSDVAETVNFSPNYLGTLIKKYTGRTFMRYLLDIRLDNAYRLLSCTEKSVKEICVEVGYSSYSNFFYAFKEKFGIVPTAIKSLPKDRRFSDFSSRRRHINN